MTNVDPDKRDVHGTSSVTAVPAEKKSAMAWLPWLIGAIILLGLLFFLLRSCAQPSAPVATTNTVTTNSVEQTSTTNTTGPATPPVGIEKITLPGGKTIDLEPKTLNYELQRFLASSESTPRRFTFDRLNFATNSAQIPTGDESTVSALAQILIAYPNAKVQLQGYADSTGGDPHNVQLGAERADAVQKSLIAQGVDAGRVKTATGGASNPVDTNATPQGRAENRRTDLVVLSK